MEYKFINVTKDLSTVEMKEQTKINIKTIKLLNEEVTRLKQVGEQEEITVEKNIEVTKETDETFDIEIESDNSLIEEINYYYSRILSEDDSVLKEFLPSLKNSNYQNIVYGICALLLKEITEIKVFIETEKDSLTKQELEDFKEEIINKQRLITEINKANVEIIDKGENEENKISNNIVFLETSSGNIYAKEDLNPNVIPSEYYAGFYELLKSIEEGTFKNVKKLTSNNNGTAGISEVKGFKRRVIFDRVGPNTYVVIGIYTKKSNKDKSYIDPLKNRIAIYRKRRDSIVEQAKNDEYIKEQHEILNEIYEMIKPKQEKEIQKEIK